LGGWSFVFVFVFLSRGQVGCGFHLVSSLCIACRLIFLLENFIHSMLSNNYLYILVRHCRFPSSSKHPERCVSGLSRVVDPRMFVRVFRLPWENQHVNHLACVGSASSWFK
jgi:hypothetical protein